MAKQLITIGAAPNDGNGDTVRQAFVKTNANFDELYAGSWNPPAFYASKFASDSNNVVLIEWSYVTLIPAYNGKTLVISSAPWDIAATITVPTELPVGFTCRVINIIPTQGVRFVTAGTTVHNTIGGTVLEDIYDSALLCSYTTDTFFLTGDLTVAPAPAPGLPEISVVATVPETAGTVNGTGGRYSTLQDPGQFTFTRTGSTAASLIVYFTVWGTATPWVDYTYLGGSIEFDIGESTKTLDVTLIDTYLDSSTDLTVNVSPTPIFEGDYVVGSPDYAAVTLVAIPEVTTPTIIGEMYSALSWTADPKAVSFDVDVFETYRPIVNSGLSNGTESRLVTGLSGSATGWNDYNALDSAQTYQPSPPLGPVYGPKYTNDYRVKATNRGGYTYGGTVTYRLPEPNDVTGGGWTSPPAAWTVAGSAPSAPTGIAIEFVDGEIGGKLAKITWANAGATAQLNCVMRSRDGGSTWERAIQDQSYFVDAGVNDHTWFRSNRVSGTATEFIDSYSVAESTTVRYRVSPMNTHPDSITTYEYGPIYAEVSGSFSGEVLPSPTFFWTMDDLIADPVTGTANYLTVDQKGSSLPLTNYGVAFSELADGAGGVGGWSGPGLQQDLSADAPIRKLRAYSDAFDLRTLQFGFTMIIWTKRTVSGADKHFKELVSIGDVGSYATSDLLVYQGDTYWYMQLGDSNTWSLSRPSTHSDSWKRIAFAWNKVTNEMWLKVNTGTTWSYTPGTPPNFASSRHHQLWIGTRNADAIPLQLDHTTFYRDKVFTEAELTEDWAQSPPYWWY